MSKERVRRVIRHPVHSVRRRRFRANGYQRLARRAVRTAEERLGSNAYQPLYGLERGGRDRPEIRPVIRRWEAIAPHLPAAGSALDVGCMNGWFTFKLAEHGLIAVGLDEHWRDLQTARLLSVHADLAGVAFSRLTVTPETAARLPSVDVTLCLSVFHHLVRFQGLDDAQRIMRSLADKSRHQLYFETGQSDEVDQPWCGELSFMGEDPAGWVEDFVASLGFDTVKRLGRFAGYKTSVERVLVVGER